jgi:hypothetical protein
VVLFWFDPFSQIMKRGGGCERGILLKLWRAFHAELKAQESNVLYEAAMPESQEGPLAAKQNEI